MISFVLLFLHSRVAHWRSRWEWWGAFPYKRWHSIILTLRLTNKQLISSVLFAPCLIRCTGPTDSDQWFVHYFLGSLPALEKVLSLVPVLCGPFGAVQWGAPQFNFFYCLLRLDVWVCAVLSVFSIGTGFYDFAWVCLDYCSWRPDFLHVRNCRLNWFHYVFCFYFIKTRSTM